MKKYYTYTWALVPEGYTEGSAVNCCVNFHGKIITRIHEEFEAANISIDHPDILTNK